MRPFPDAPSFARELVSVGVTGTNGKTTITTLTSALLGLLARPVARITTKTNSVRIRSSVHHVISLSFLAVFVTSLVLYSIDSADDVAALSAPVS